MEKLVQVAKILSDINRVKIIALMYREEELCVCEICDTLDLSQPLVSRHLKLMREAQMVSTKQQGKWVIYSLNKSQISECFLDILKTDEQTLPPLVVCAKNIL